ncbi:hypothetical protein ES705_42332 [subsurface metagenome]
MNAGANLSTITEIENAKYDGHFGIGMYFTWKFHENWQLQPEFFFRFPGGARKLPPYSIDNPEFDPILENSSIIRISNYLSLPVHIRYRVWKQFRVSFAPQISLMVSNQDIFYKSLEDEDEVFYNRNSMKELNRFDFGLSAGVSYKLRQGKGVNLEARYYFGFIDTDNIIEGATVMNRSICLYVGIPIGAEKDVKAESSKE